MRNQLLAASIIAISGLGFANQALAQKFSTSIVYGDTTQDNAVCYVYNSHPSSPVRVGFAHIGVFQGTSITQETLSTNDCARQLRGVLPAGRGCAFIASNIQSDLAHECDVTIFGSEQAIQGVRIGFEIRNNSDKTLQHVEAR